MTEIESVVKPDCIADDFRRKAVTFVYIHTTILAASRLNLAIPEEVPDVIAAAVMRVYDELQALQAPIEN